MGHEIGKVFLFNFKLFFWRFSCQKRAFLWTDLQKNKTVSGVKSFLPLELVFAIMMLFAFFKEICEDGKYKMYMKEDIACTDEKPPMLLLFI